MFNGTSQYISTVNAYINPTSTSTSVWFKTTTNVGGALLGFSSLQTGLGGSRDRFIYMTSTGIIYLATAPGAVKKYVSSTLSYNDGAWHMATSTIGASGLKLYIDGSLITSDPTVTSGETTTGYWRIGYSDLSTWPNEPSSYYFSGTLDDAVIYLSQRADSCRSFCIV
ncbi:LamG-like jellyroll fold domain-containing protein [Pedobacter sp. NJ-S-72]